jgi:16S rRNA (cytidine1402-2'-O)-methyltransferase
MIMAGAKGRLFLLPNVLDERSAPEISMPGAALAAIRRLRHFIAESDRSAWRLLAKLLDRQALDEVRIERLDEHSDPTLLPELLAPVEAGDDMGLMSDAGMPCVADPGGALVALAHDRGIQVVPTGGPSSILLALSASGLDGQRFSFLGYLPQERALRRLALADIDRDARTDGATRIFIETPYRNAALLDDCLSILSPRLRLCVAASLTSTDEHIRSASPLDWKSGGWRPGKEAAIFLVGIVPSLSIDRSSSTGHSRIVCKNRKR